MSQGSSHSHNYADDVPIVMSEKWKIPPLPNITEDLVAPFFEVPLKLQQNIPYDFSLEHKVLDKIAEWKLVRTRELNEREERIKHRQEENRRRLEAEGTKLKEQLTQVSYPSPDEFSSSDEEVESKNDAPVKGTEQKSFNFGSILTPTIVNRENDTEALTGVKSSNNIWNCNKNTNKLELADFENDASDPFYNLELKTIDDLDVLAQVLKTSNVLHSKLNNAKSEEKHNSDDEQKTQEGSQENQSLPESSDKPIISKQNGLTSQEPYQYINNYAANYNTPNTYSSNYNQFQPVNQPTVYTSANQVQNNNCGLYGNYANMYSNNYLPTTYRLNSNFTMPYVNSNAIDYRMQHSFSPPPQVMYQASNNADDLKETQHTLAQSKLKSKSVPDIVKELEDEIQDSERRRTRNNSQSNDKRIASAKSNKKIMQSQKNDSRKNMSCDELILEKLPKDLQQLARNISQMGFPLDRVCRVAQQFEGDDKKMIEHLIPLSELLDLGFEEKTISDALIKFDNNKEMALDFLIS